MRLGGGRGERIVGFGVADLDDLKLCITMLPQTHPSIC